MLIPIIKRILTAVTICLMALVLAVAIVGFYFNNWLNEPLTIKGDKVFVVTSGQGFGRVAAKLAREGIIDQPELLKIYGRLAGVDRNVRAGEYRIPAGMTVLELINHLSLGDVIRHAVTLVEGHQLTQSLQQWQDSRLTLTAEKDRDVAIKALLKIDAPSPEGLFFSDTYFFEAGDSDLDILRRAHRKLLKVLNQEWQSRLPNLPYKSAYEALVMASIIERETAVASERPVIAGVFIRRLQQGMRLQSDPTVIYGMGDSYHGHINRRDLTTRTPYNTYQIKGLPPTPISSVGRDAIRAALHPTAGKSLYFVARGDGTHVFSSTLAEHNEAVRKYQLNRRSDYRSTPEQPSLANQQEQSQ